MWYLAKRTLKVQIEKIYCFIVVRVICVYDLRKKIDQACQPATFVSEAMLRATYQVVHFQVCLNTLVNPLTVTNLSTVLQTTEVRVMGL